MTHAQGNNSPVQWRRAKSYRPERHYMRGPGPKCREKHVVSYGKTVRQPSNGAAMTSQAQATELLRGWRAAECGLPFDPAQSLLWRDGYRLRCSNRISHL
jgi:hypothetical protein